MFRDDLKAAMSRAEQLQRDLVEAEERADRSDDELDALRERLAAQERELDVLRKRKDDPPRPDEARREGRRRRRSMLLLAVAGMFVAGTAVAAVLLLRAPSPLPNAPVVQTSGPTTVGTSAVAPAVAPAPRIVFDAAGTTFVAFIRSLSEKCTVGPTGWISRCNPEGLRREIRRREESVGMRAAVLGYCSLLWAPSQKLRLLAGNRLGGMYPRSLEAADEDCFRCLDHFVRHGMQERWTAPVARSWALVGLQLGHRKAVLAAVDGLERYRRAHALRGLWAGGRLSVLPQLAAALNSGDDELAQAALDSFGYGSWTEAERAKVCPLFEQTMQKARGRWAGRVAYRTGGSGCDDAFKQRVFERIVQEVGSQQPVDYWWVAALGALGRRSQRKPWRPKVVALLERLVRAPEQTDYRRGQALDELRGLDRARATQLATTLGGSHGKDLRRAVERTLSPAKKAAGK